MSGTFDCFGIKICQLNISELLSEIERCVFQRHQFIMTYLNFHTTNIIRRNRTLFDIFRAFDLVIPDGIAIEWALRSWGMDEKCKNILRYAERIWFPIIYSKAAEKGWGVYLLGGKPGAANKVDSNLKKTIIGLKIVGTYHGYIESGQELQKVIEEINQAQATILMVGMGQTKQEEWIIANRHQLNVSVIIAVGGYFDKVYEIDSDYPEWVYRHRLFWFYRLLKEPKRLWKRYTIGIVIFCLRVFWARFKLALQKTEGAQPNKQAPD